MVLINNSHQKVTRVAKLKPFLSVPELKQRYRQALHPIEARRWQLLWLVALSKTIKEAAAIVGINYDNGLGLSNLEPSDVIAK